MGFLTPVLGAIGTIASIGGTIMSVAGAMQEGREQKARFQYEQKVAAQQADEAAAASQRDAMARYREGRQLLSQQQAAIAGSGGSMTDPSVIDIMDDTSERVRLAAETDIYKGDQQARGYNDAAKVAGYNAESAMRAARIRAAGSLFSGMSSLFSRFGESNKKTQDRSSVSLPYNAPR
ncbi:hypothetical protein N7E70_021110 [Aminobacter sp. NyZ550]|uniref:hypothetical protein n=1 Tax=Aminobacter sp. NyZ550 TaxID=2979870 RepID=UPI0021D59EE9|nr:hypothetical protein [Aminobacter sp. NyZ550]WAX94153.1 hypothetical protein N7E70_021110 [Aminobacter sp. NyZ550]